MIFAGNPLLKLILRLCPSFLVWITLEKRKCEQSFLSDMRTPSCVSDTLGVQVCH